MKEFEGLARPATYICISVCATSLQDVVRYCCLREYFFFFKCIPIFNGKSLIVIMIGVIVLMSIVRTIMMNMTMMVKIMIIVIVIMTMIIIMTIVIVS